MRWPRASEGDQLVVAGRLRGRLLLAEAYLNRTVLVRGDAGRWTNLAGATFCFLLGAAGLGWALLWPLVMDASEVEVWGQVLCAGLGLLFCGLGSYCLWRWLHIRAAVRLVKGR
jgi:hypothetical protein